MQANELLQSYIDDYFEAVDRLGYDGVKARQEGRFASLADGAAGIAYAHWHVARQSGREDLLEGAERWIGWAWESRHDGPAFFPQAGGAKRDLLHGAFLFGQLGLCFARLLIARAGGRQRQAGRALDDFVARCRRPGGSTALFEGSAGMLQATTLLLHLTGDERLLDLGCELAARLRREAAPLDGRPIAWTAAPGPALAHGAAGVLLAMLSWYRASGSPAPPAVSAQVDLLVDGALRRPQRLCPRPSLLASLCNGLTGVAVLALEAHAVLGGTRYLAAARRAAELALEDLPPRPDLCCGRAGVAAVCRSLAALDPAGPWRRHAVELTLSALLCEPGDYEVSGLYGGEAALPCLAADLLAGTPGGLPALVWPLAGAASDACLPRLVREAS